MMQRYATSHKTILSNSSVVLQPILSISQLTQSPSQEPCEWVLKTIVCDVKQLQSSSSHHTLRYIIGQEILCS